MSKANNHSFLFSFALWPAYILCCILFSCTPASEVGTISGGNPFFDLKAYFESEIERLNTDPPFVKKRVTYNGKTETQSSSDNDFAQELQLFTKADINRPAWTDKYRADTLTSNSHLDKLIYTALDSSLVIREISINYEEGNIARVDIYKEQKSFVAKSNQHLYYVPGEGYSIESFQKTMLTKPKNLKIEVDFRQ